MRRVIRPCETTMRSSPKTKLFRFIDLINLPNQYQDWLIIQQNQQMLRTLPFHNQNRLYRSTRYRPTESIQPCSFQDRPRAQTTAKRQSATVLSKKQVPEQRIGTGKRNSTYLDTWHCLMNQSETSGKQCGRVCLPTLVHFGESIFTELDPLYLPIQHITKSIEETSQLLPEPKLVMGKIRASLKNLDSEILLSLKEITAHGERELKRLRDLLSCNHVAQQEQKMRMRKGIDGLREDLGAIRNTFEKSKASEQKLQMEIFSCTALKVGRVDIESEEFPQDYF